MALAVLLSLSFVAFAANESAARTNPDRLRLAEISGAVPTTSLRTGAG